MIPNYSTTIKPELTIKQLWADTPTAAADRTSALVVGPQYTGQSLSASSEWVDIASLPASGGDHDFFIAMPGADSATAVDDVVLHVRGFGSGITDLRVDDGVVSNGVSIPDVAYATLTANGDAVRDASQTCQVKNGDTLYPVYFFYTEVGNGEALVAGALYANATDSTATVGGVSIPAHRVFVAEEGDTCPAVETLVQVSIKNYDVLGSEDYGPFADHPVVLGTMFVFVNGTSDLRTVTGFVPAKSGLEDLTTQSTVVSIVRGGDPAEPLLVDSSTGPTTPFYSGTEATDIVCEVISGGGDVNGVVGADDEISFRVSDSRGLITPYTVVKPADDEYVDLGFNLRLIIGATNGLNGTDGTTPTSVFSFPVSPGEDSATVMAGVKLSGVVPTSLALPVSTGVSRLTNVNGMFYTVNYHLPVSGEALYRTPADAVQFAIIQQDGRYGLDVGDDTIKLTDDTTFVFQVGTAFVEWKQIVEPADNEPPVLVDGLTVADELGDAFGANLLRNAVDVALKGSGGKAVYALRTSGEGSEDYEAALSRIENLDAAMYLTAPTFSRTVRTLFQAHVEGASQETTKNWRRAYLPLDAPTAFPVLQAKASGTPYAMTIATHSGEFVLVTCADALFTTLGLRAGDTLRYNFATLASGEEIYVSYEIDKVMSDTQLLLASGPAAAVTSATRFELWKSNTADNMVTYCNNEAALLSSARINLVWSDSAQTVDLASGATTSVNMLYAGAYVAGLRSATPVTKGLTNSSVAGFIHRAPLFYTKYKARHIEAISAGGVWVLGQEGPSLTPKIYHQVTTKTDSGPEYYEDNVGIRHDIVDYALKDAFDGYVGAVEASKITLGELYRVGRTALSNLASDKVGETQSPVIENFRSTSEQEEGTIDIDFHPTNKASFICKADLAIPLPLNRIAWITTGYAGGF